jgi:hypothetical protein
LNEKIRDSVRIYYVKWRKAEDALGKLQEELAHILGPGGLEKLGAEDPNAKKKGALPPGGLLGLQELIDDPACFVMHPSLMDVEKCDRDSSTSKLMIPPLQASEEVDEKKKGLWTNLMVSMAVCPGFKSEDEGAEFVIACCDKAFPLNMENWARAKLEDEWREKVRSDVSG